MNHSSIIAHLNLPSPVELITTEWIQKAGVELRVKRDDLIHPLISGNKWRKLSGILGRSREIKRVETYGGAYSNHLVAVACASFYLNMPSTGWVRGAETRKENKVMYLCQSLGMELKFLDREEFKQRKRQVINEEDVLYIPEGGYCLDGTLGFEELLDEQDAPDYVIIASGTGTSLAGISRGVKQRKWDCEVIGVPALKGASFLFEDCRKLNAGQFNLWLEYHFGGYAKTNPDLLDFLAVFNRETGILLDPIYTGKAMFALKDKLLTGYFREGAKILFIHTGGISGWLGQADSELKKKAEEKIFGSLKVLLEKS